MMTLSALGAIVPPLALLAAFGSACQGTPHPVLGDASTPTGLVPAASDAEAAAGAPGLADEYYPLLGNGGYDVLQYDLSFDIDVEANQVEARAQIDARALQHLISFNLDFDGLQVDRITVDGRVARFSRADGELTITPQEIVREGQAMRVVIDYSGQPGPVSDPGVPFADVGWTHTDSGIYVVSEPSGSSGWFPVNDHPTDKALYTIRVDVPKPYVAASNGLLVERKDEGERTEFVWKHAQPMSSYLVTLAISKFEEHESEGPGGLPILDYYHSGLSERGRANFARQGEVIAFLEERFGPYPFESAGAIVTDAPVPGALETQTRPIYGKGATSMSVIVHEIAHQWFGNDVTLGAWKDIWLNEGFASYSEWLWSEAHAEKPESVEKRMRSRYQMLVIRGVAPAGDPGVEGIFGAASYVRGAFLLHALRLEVGDETFFEILRTYLKKHHFDTAVSQDFVAVAEEVSGKDLEAFFQGWLYADEIPAVPQLGLDPDTVRAEYEKSRAERAARNAERKSKREEKKHEREERKKRKESGGDDA